MIGRRTEGVYCGPDGMTVRVFWHNGTFLVHDWDGYRPCSASCALTVRMWRELQPPARTALRSDQGGR